MKKFLIITILSMIAIFTAAACSPSSTSLSLQPVTNQHPAAQVPATTQPAAAADSSVRTLTVTGNGTVMLTPDIAHVTIGVHTENDDVSAGIDANNASVQKVRDALEKFGLDAKDIQTQNFSVYTIQNVDSTGKPSGSRYAIDNSLYVTVRNMSQLGKLLGEVTRSGANNINGISFDIADKSAALVDARKQALDNAQKQAQEMAANLNVKLGDVQSAVVSNVEYPGPIPYGLGGAAASQNSANVPISAGQITVQVNIEVVYEID
jgi:uncharacterized protein